MFTANATPANDSERDPKDAVGRVPAVRSAAYVNGRATRHALHRRGVHADRFHVRGSAGEIPLGAHILTPRRGYTHHGIYVGDGKVVHYAGLHRALGRGPIEEVTLEEFADGQRVIVKSAASVLYPAAVVVERARSRLGENRYRITTNNCEHFCEWCLCGQSRSEQVERLFALPRKLVLVLITRVRQRLVRARGVRAGIGAA
jgi:hypothetical protein